MRRRIQKQTPTRSEGEEVEVLRGAIAAEERHHRGQALEPAEIRVGDLRHALLAARHLVPLEADGPDDLGEGERQHGEVDLGEAHAEEAEDEGEEPGDQPRRREGEEEGHAELLHEEPRRVRADAEVRGVAEGDQPRVADEQVQARGEQRPDHDVIGEEGVVARARRGHEEQRRQHQEPPRRAPRGHRELPVGAAPPSLRRPTFGQTSRRGHLSGRPRRPHGRMMSTAAMRTKTEKMEKRGMNRMPKDSTWP